MHIDTSRKAKATALNMTPMIDVVFLLITFFMVVSEISWQDMLEIEPPRTRASQEFKGPEAIIVTVTHDGAYHLGGEQLDIERLARVLAIERRLDPDRQMHIRADRRVPFRHIRAILRRCIHRDIRIRNIAFCTKPLDA